MTDKIICPWCGAEMKIHDYALNSRYYIAYAECTGCGAYGPDVSSKENAEMAKKAAHAAALRRYTPPIKPMTFDDVMCASETYAVVWVEDIQCSYANGYAAPKHKELYDGSVRVQLWYPGYNEDERRYKEDYNKTWRCWKRKPTDEERSAAEWET